MKALIDLILLAILVVCVWNGYKKGLIMGVGGILCIIVAIYGANLLATTFSGDVVPALRPFANGYTESVLSSKDSVVMKNMGWDDSELSEEDLLSKYPERRQEFCAECYKALGIDALTADVMADRALEYVLAHGVAASAAVSQILCETVCYAGCFLLAFLLIIIVLTVLGNLPNFSFKLPRAELVNDIGGAVLGLVTGLMFCILLIWALKFMGILIGKDTLASTTIGGWLLKKNFLLKYLGI